MDIELNISKSIFNDAYAPYITDYSHRYEVYFGGAGSGKSIFVFQKIAVKALKSKRRVLVVRKVSATHYNSTFTVLLDILSKFEILKYCSVNKSTMRITLPNESEFIFAGCDDSEKLKSIANITDIVVEEATELSLDDVTQLDIRLRALAPNLQIFYMFNPVSKANWVYKKWFDEKSVIDKDTLIIKTTYKDNRFLPKKYIETLENTINSNPTYYKVYALGEFCSLDKLIFNNWEIREYDSFEFDEAIFGLDFGYTNDPSAFVAAKVNKKTKEIYIYDEMYKTAMVNSDIVNWIQQSGYSKEMIIADSAEPKSIEEIRRAGIGRIKPAWKGKGSILTGIDILKQYKIYVNPKCENMITELSNYAWKRDKKTGEYVNEPDDSFNHLCDALRYAIQKISLCGFTTMSKSLLGL